MEDGNVIKRERRGSRSRPFERSFSYSAAIGNSSVRSSIEIPNIVNTNVYNNEELKNRYRISQTYVEGKEIEFPIISNGEVYYDFKTQPEDNIGEVFRNPYASSEETTDDDEVNKGIIMKIDVQNDESPKLSTPSTHRHFSDVSTQPLVSSSLPTEDFDGIEIDDNTYNSIPTNTPSSHGYSTPFSKRKKIISHRRKHGGRLIRSRRVVLKDGEENVPVRSNIPFKSIKYLRDLVNTVINAKWRFIIVLMIVSHFSFWFFFAGIWYAVTRSYQDDIGDGKEHCVTGTSSFAGLLMMSVETQMTIGYGVRYPNEECPEAITVMVLELVAGTALSGGLASLLFLKLVRPNRHVTYVGFSKKATVCLRDGQLCLTFRVWDLMNLHIIGSEVTAYMLKPIRTLEGVQFQNYIHQLKLKHSRAFLLWPITVVHVIDAASPLYDLSAQDMMDYRFEIVVCLTGSSKNMGTVTQSRSSYLSKEIIWGYRFKNVLKYSKEKESYIIDVDNLNTTEEVETPLCSANQLSEFQQDLKTSRQYMTVSPTELSIPEDSSTISTGYNSVLSSPNASRSTPRSNGWSFKKFSSVKRDDYISEERL